MATLRSVPLTAEVGSEEYKSFAGLVDRPLVVVGNGPSSAMPPYQRIPADAVIFRMNWFFLEGNYHFGRRVDAWFSAVPNETMERMLQDEIRSGRYDVHRIATPMRMASHRDGDRYGLDPLTRHVEQLDSWSVPARNPRLARHFMSRPGLPTTGMQALAFGLGVGFREIYLAGIDLYESKDRRYGWAVPQAAAAALQPKDLLPGYESDHGIDTDLAFLQSCLAEFPDARIRSVSSSDALHVLVPPAEDLIGRPALDATATVGRPKESILVQLPATEDEPAVTVPAADGPLWKEIDGRRCAYVTVVSGNHYHHGARALANSLRKVTDVPLVVLCGPGVDRVALNASGIATIEVPNIVNPLSLQGRRAVRARRMQPRFESTYTKLQVFRLGFLDRVVYIDADAIVRANIDELFDGDDFAAVPDAGIDVPTGATFNSGVFACSPSYELFEQMMSRLRTVESSDGGDQGFLNVFFPTWRRLPLAYNTTKRMFSHHPHLYRDEDVKVLHYVGPKPWEPAGQPERYDELDYAWLDHLTESEKDELIRDLRRSKTIRPEPPSAVEGLRRAEAELRAGRAGDAAKLLEETRRSRLLSTPEQRVLATAYIRQGQRLKALSVLSRARKVSSRVAVGHAIASAYARRSVGRALQGGVR